jgi:hypothetical protein
MMIIDEEFKLGPGKTAADDFRSHLFAEFRMV